MYSKNLNSTVLFFFFFFFWNIGWWRLDESADAWNNLLEYGGGGGCDINMFEQAFTWKFLGHLPNITPAFDSRKFLCTDYHHHCTDKCIPVEYSICVIRDSRQTRYRSHLHRNDNLTTTTTILSVKFTIRSLNDCRNSVCWLLIELTIFFHLYPSFYPFLMYFTSLEKWYDECIRETRSLIEWRKK